MNSNPPKIFLRFFRWFCHPDLKIPIEGDLMELYDERLLITSKKKANWQFILDVLFLLRPSIIRPIDGTYRLNHYGMLKNYIKVSTRNILRNKTFSLLNITGLSIGIASCILILIFVKNELSYDAYHSQYDNTYRVIHYYGNEAESSQEIPQSEFQVWGCAPVAPALKDYFPEIESVFRFTSPSPFLVSYDGRSFQENDFVYADSTAFNIFDWKLLEGNPKTALSRPRTIVLTADIAKKYFGDTNPVGKTLLMDSHEKYEVTGVMENMPSNSHFKFDAMISMSTFKIYRPGIFDAWGYVDFYTYFTITPQNDIANIEASTDDFLKKHFTSKFDYQIGFEPLSKAYLYSKAGRQPGITGSLNNIYIFLSVAVFILLIASINFMNLSTARSVERAKEVAIRKTIGSHRGALIFQFLVEAILLTFLAFTFAIVFIVIGHSYLDELSGKTLSIEWLLTPQNIFFACLGVIGLGIITGSYPAFVLSNFKPIKVLKGSFKTSFTGIWLRKILVVVQFSLSVILIVGATVVYSQLNHLQNHDLGFNPDQVLVVDFGWDGKVQNKLKVIKNEFSKHEDVQSISASRATPGEFFPNAGTGIETPSGEIVFHGPAIYEIDEDFVPTFQMKIAAGRNFSKNFPSDSSSALLLNEAAAKLYGYSNPKEVVGKAFKQWGKEGKVVGLIEDFNYVSLHSKVEPLSLRYSTIDNTSRFSMRINSDNYSKTLGELEDIWKELVPHRPFISYFNDQKFQKQYEADERFGYVFTIFSFLAIFVACLGLFGLTIYSTSQRAKEISIRKVLGASTQNIVTILSYDFLGLFSISLIIGIPISWYIMNGWLQEFAYRISLGWEIFAFAALITLVISFLTMSLKTINAALSNPVDSLRNE